MDVGFGLLADEDRMRWGWWTNRDAIGLRALVADESKVDDGVNEGANVYWRVTAGSEVHVAEEIPYVGVGGDRCNL